MRATETSARDKGSAGRGESAWFKRCLPVPAAGVTPQPSTVGSEVDDPFHQEAARTRAPKLSALLPDHAAVIVFLDCGELEKLLDGVRQVEDEWHRESEREYRQYGKPYYKKKKKFGGLFDIFD